MKKQIQQLKLVLPLLLILAVSSSFAQKEFTHVATKDNNGCNGDCTLLNVPELDANPAAIIWVTPIIEKGLNLNPHPIGVYYFKNKWSIFNLDQKVIPAGAKFKVEYVMSPDPNHFQYSFTPENIQRDGSAFIDHPALNNNPNIKFSALNSWNPESNRGIANREEIVVEFNPDAGKWHVSNINKKPLFARVAYNIIVSSGGKPETSSATYNAVQIKELRVTPNSTSPSGNIAAMYMTVWSNGTKLPGDNIMAGFLDKTEIQAYEMGVSSLSASGQTGKRSYEPLTIKSHTGFPVTIPLFDAFVKNSNMAFTIEAFSHTSAGTRELNYTIKLTGARIVSFKQVYEESGLHIGTNAKKYYDEIKITFTSIEFDKVGGYTVVDTK